MFFVFVMRMLNSDVFESSRVLKNAGPMIPLLVMANHEIPDLLSSDAFVCPLMVKFLLSPLSHLWPSGFAYQQNCTKLHITILGVLPNSGFAYEQNCITHPKLCYVRNCIICSFVLVLLIRKAIRPNIM